MNCWPCGERLPAYSEKAVQAIESIEAEPPDLVILDMLMPNRDGIETLGDLRRRWPAVKVIMVSAGARMLDAEALLNAAKALGADATLGKPLDRIRLIELVRSLVG